MREQKITLGEMRQFGVTGVLVYSSTTGVATTSRPATIAGLMKFASPISNLGSSAGLVAGAARTCVRIFSQREWVRWS